MNPFRLLLALFLLPLLLPAGAQTVPEAPEELTSMLETNTLVLAVLDKKNIHVQVEGSSKIEFETALKALKLDNLIGRMEEAWEVVKDEPIHFKVQQDDAVTYSYTDRKGRPTTVVELLRHVLTTDGRKRFDMVFHSSGRRGFGKFEALTVFTAWSADETGVSRYASEVYAYPENGFARFFARHLKLVERFFQKESRTIEEYAADIASYIVDTMGDEVTDAVQTPEPGS